MLVIPNVLHLQTTEETGEAIFSAGLGLARQDRAREREQEAEMPALWTL